MEISFKDKRALVTGASRGVGRAIAVALAKGGAEVFALAHSEDKLTALCAEQPNITAVVCDLRDSDQIREKVKAVLPIHLLVNDAAIVNAQPFLEIDMKSFDEVLQVNTRAPFIISQMIASDLIGRSLQGSIVNISGIATKLACSNVTSYCMTKSAVNQLTRSMAKEISSKGVRVNSLAPQLTQTELLMEHFKGHLEDMQPYIDRVPLQRVAAIHEVVSVVLFLLSDKASMVNGSLIPVDGGFLISGV